MKGIIVISIFLFLKCAGKINQNEQTKTTEEKRNLADRLKDFDKMGANDSFFLNDYEAKYLNLKYGDKDFDFANKKVFFFGPGGLVFSDKKRYFGEFRRHDFIESHIYIFDECEKQESGGFDVAIVYWTKKNYSIQEVISRLKQRSN